MCYTSFDCNSSFPRIAKKDIRCYKVIYCYEGKIKSLFYGFIYKIGKVTPHINLTAEKHYPRPVDSRVLSIEAGYHSFCLLQDARRDLTKSVHDYEYIASCIIPKGAVYYTNGCDNVSSCIIVKRILKSNKRKYKKSY